MSQPLIIYHKDCPDGFGAALSAWLKFDDEEGAEFAPYQYGTPAPNVAGREVYMLDFSWKRPEMELMRRQATKLVVIDHHKTAEKELEGFPDCIFDMEHSGAYLAWKYFHPEKPVPHLIQYVEDRDLWKHQLSGSEEINLAIMSFPYDFAIWNKWLTQDLSDLYQSGKVVKMYRDRQIERTLQHVKRKRYLVEKSFKEFPGAGVPLYDEYDVPSVNCPLFQSDLGAVLCKGEPFAEMWWETKYGIQYSLRSEEPNGMDVSEIAKGFGGGGHKHAAGYQISKP